MRHFPIALLAITLAAPAVAQEQDFSQVEIQTESLGPGLAMLTGAGGNLAVAWSADGAFLVDDQFAPLTDKIRAAIAKLTERPLRFVLNTHWHGDHTGGNENLGRAGTLIVAHDNVRARMSTEQFQKMWNERTPPSPAAALPVVTFTDAVTFHLGGEEIHAFHVPPAHTDGDAIVHFRRADVLHAGDLFFNGFYPFVDLDSGGSFAGALAAAEGLLELAGAETRIVPGHGPLARRADLEAYVAMLHGVRDAVAPLVAAGKSIDEIVAARPTAPWDERWGGGFMKPEVFTRIVATGLGAR